MEQMYYVKYRWGYQRTIPEINYFAGNLWNQEMCDYQCMIWDILTDWWLPKSDLSQTK